MARIIPIPIGPIYNEGSCRGMVHVVKSVQAWETVPCKRGAAYVCKSLCQCI